MGDQYDGFVVGDPGFRLPLAAIANMKGAQVYNSLKSDPNATDIGTGFTAAERATVSNAVLAKCDALDGVADGWIQLGLVPDPQLFEQVDSAQARSHPRYLRIQRPGA